MHNLSARVAKLETAISPQWLGELDALLLRVLGADKASLPMHSIEIGLQQPMAQSFDELVELALAKP